MAPRAGRRNAASAARREPTQAPTPHAVNGDKQRAEQDRVCLDNSGSISRADACCHLGIGQRPCFGFLNQGRFASGFDALNLSGLVAGSRFLLRKVPLEETESSEGRVNDRRNKQQHGGGPQSRAHCPCRSSGDGQERLGKIETAKRCGQHQTVECNGNAINVDDAGSLYAVTLLSVSPPYSKATPLRTKGALSDLSVGGFGGMAR